MSREHDAHFTGLWVAQCAKREAFKTGGNVDFDVPVVQPAARLPDPLEKDIQKAVLEALQRHPKVAWAQRFNTGGMEREYKGEKRYIQFAFTGCADIIGQLKTGAFLAIECKRRQGNPTSAQIAFLTMVNRHGGNAFVARSVDDVMRGLR